MDIQQHSLIKKLEQEWNCPISKVPMKDPVITSDGHTYDRQAIIIWLRQNSKSPITNIPLESTQLIPNIAFKNIISKLNTQLPSFIAKQQGLKTEIDQLKEQIEYLKNQLQYQKQRNEQLCEKQEKSFKSKKIEKSRNQQKSNELKKMRECKNKYQTEIHQLKIKQQQQTRQINQLKQELAFRSQNHEKVSAEKRKLQASLKIVTSNCDQIIKKLRFTFISNFLFIGHLLQSIEDMKNNSDEQKKEKGTQQNLGFIEEQNQQNLNRETVLKVMQQLQQKIKCRVNNEQSKERTYHYDRLIITRRIMAQRRLQIMNQPNRVQNNQIQQRQNQQIQGNNIPASLPNNQIPVSQNLESTQQNSDLYKQLMSIKWMMSKKNYTQIPSFYSMQVCGNNNEEETFWYGVKLSIRESQIPFVEFLPYFWKHVRWLNLAACEINDQIWQQFIEKADNFQNLVFINLNRNNVTRIKKSDLEKFRRLNRFTVMRNELTKQSEDEIHKYQLEHPQVKVFHSMNQINGPVFEGNIFDNL